MVTDPRLHAGLLREAVAACDRGEAIEFAAVRFGVSVADLRTEMGFTSKTRVAMAEYRMFGRRDNEPVGVAGY